MDFWAKHWAAMLGEEQNQKKSDIPMGLLACKGQFLLELTKIKLLKYLCFQARLQFFLSKQSKQKALEANYLCSSFQL